MSRLTIFLMCCAPQPQIPEPANNEVLMLTGEIVWHRHRLQQDQGDLSTTKLLDQTTRPDQNKPNRKYIWLTIHALSIIHIVFWILTWYGILLKWHTSHIDLQVKTAWTSWGCLAPVINFLSGGQSGHMHHEAPHPNVCDIKIYIIYLYLYLYLGQFGHMHHDPVCVILR